MKQTLLLLSFPFVVHFCYSQDVVSIDYLMETPVTSVDVYKVDYLDSTKVYIPFDFSASDTEIESRIDSLLSKNKAIEKIDFVYTQFRVSEDFDQDKLNRERLELLHRNARYIFDNNVIDWKFYRQTNNFGLEENKGLFHGFVIHYLTHPTYEGNDGGLSTEEEIDAILDYLVEVKLPETKTEMGGIVEGCKGYLPLSKRKREKGITYKKKLFGLFRKRDTPCYDTSWTTYTVAGVYMPFVQDTVVMRTLRNYYDEWNCNYVVEDVTGSMYPYIAQTLAWKKLKMDSAGIEHFVFFNDGDSRPDGPIGKSGGAYYINSNSYKKVTDFVAQVMRKGNGGGAAENNIEATIYAEDSFDESESYILIADNYAPIRDMKISEKVKKPTHIILCGVRNGRIHHSYIKLALQTGGTLHTIEEDIVGIEVMKPGDIFEMGGQKWMYNSRGDIVLVR